MKRFQALLLCCLIGAASAEEIRFGRLFFTPVERSALEAARQNNQPPQEIVEPGYSAASVVITSAISVNGFVRRSDGKGTVWVNGQPIQEGTAAHEVEVGKLRADSDKVQLKHAGGRRAIALKAGQHYDSAIGKAGDSISESPAAVSSATIR